jgi:hypothetical protein
MSQNTRQINYSNAIVYKICCKDPQLTDIYIGSTCDLRRRKWSHKSVCNNENNTHYNKYAYQFIRNNGGWDNWEIIVVEECNIENKTQLRQRERHWLETLKASLNKCVPARTVQEYQKQYQQEHKEQLSEYQKQYRQEHKEQIEQRRSVIINCDCGSSIKKKNIIRHYKTNKHKKYIQQQQLNN